MDFDIKQIPVINICKAVAFILNADGYKNTSGEKLTGEHIYNYSPTGELFGVMGVAEYLEHIFTSIIPKYSENQLAMKWTQIIIEILRTGNEYSGEYTRDLCSGIGKNFVKIIWG